MGRHAGLFGSKDVEIGFYRGTWINCLSPPAYHLEKLRTCQSVPVYRRTEGRGASTRARILRPPWWPRHRHQPLLLLFHSITTPNVRSLLEFGHPFGQRCHRFGEGDSGHRTLHLGIYGRPRRRNRLCRVQHIRSIDQRESVG